MNRRGQIFLIMTILVITFLIGISSVLLEVSRSDYVQPVSDSDVVLQAWDNTYESINQILLVRLSINSQGPTGNQLNIDLRSELGKLETYLNKRGLSAIIQSQNIDYTIIGDQTTDTTVTITGSFTVHLASSGVEIDQTFDLSISYNAVISGSNIIVSSTLNSDINFISGSSITSTNIAFTYLDNLNGNYPATNLAGGDTIIILTPNQIDLQLVV